MIKKSPYKPIKKVHMNKKTKNYKTKHKPPAERLQQPKLLRPGWKHWTLIGTLAAGYGLALYGLGNHLTKRERQTIEQQRTAQLKQENQEYFELFKDQLVIADFTITNQEGKEEEIKKFMQRSINGEEAKGFARGIANGAYALSKGKEYSTLEDKTKLAKEVMDTARSAIQMKEYGGQGNYTQDYEYAKEKKKLRKDLTEEEEKELADWTMDSRQTFDEHYGPKEGKEFAGDCDDFSTTLTTAYHAIRNYAEENKGKDEFYKALAEGLRHYRIVSVYIPEHAVNLALTRTADGVIKAEAIEPSHMESKIKTVLQDDKLKIKYPSNKSEKTAEIIKLFGKDISAYAK